MPAPSSVLLVGPDAPAWAAAVSPEGVSVTPAHTIAAARAYLSGTAFDAVYVQEGAGPVDGLTALRDVLGLSTTVEAVRHLDDVRSRLGGAAGGAEGGAAGGAPPEGAGVRDALEALRAEMGRVAHALNNPLAVIAGNAQLGLELSQAVETDEAVVESLRNIAEAAGDLQALFREVAALRAEIDRLLGPT